MRERFADHLTQQYMCSVLDALPSTGSFRVEPDVTASSGMSAGESLTQAVQTILARKHQTRIRRIRRRKNRTRASREPHWKVSRGRTDPPRFTHINCFAFALFFSHTLS